MNEPQILPPAPAALEALPAAQLERMRAAAIEIRECERALHKGGLNLVGEMLRGQGKFVKLSHYPEGDVFDHESHSQYYYHAHRPDEHGHFHTFLRAGGMPRAARPAPEAQDRDWPAGDHAVAHIIAISMDKKGKPLGLFTTNRWVTGETWYAAEHVATMIDYFSVDHAYPSWPTNRWVTAMVRLFKPQIIQLLHERDAALNARRAAHPDRDVFEDRDFEVLSETAIDMQAQIASIDAALARR